MISHVLDDCVVFILQLERIETLEVKISTELKELESRANSMSDDIKKFKDLRGLQDSADATREYLEQLIDGYTTKIQRLDELTNKLSHQYEEKTQKLENSLTWRNLEKLKSKLREQGQTIFDLQENVKKMKAKTDFGGTKLDCLQLVEKINSAVITDMQ